MSKKLVVKLQTPVVERKISTKDATGMIDSIVVGFKRYNATDAKAKLEEYQKIVLPPEIEELFSRFNELTNKRDSLTAEDLIAKTEELREISANLQEKQQKIEVNLLNFLRQEVVYLRDVTLYMVEDGQNTEFNVKDTRKEKPLEDFWTSPEECLDFLLTSFFDSNPWRSKITEAFQQLLPNVSEAEQAKEKN